jgi:hypothetical protein
MELDAKALRAKLKEEPYHKALLCGWRTEGLEGLLAHYLAGADFARSLADAPGQVINTDDRNRVEFGFAKDVGNFKRVGDFFLPIRREKEDRPVLSNDDADHDRVKDERFLQIAGEGNEPGIPEDLNSAQEVRAQAVVNWISGNIDGGLAKWQFQEREPSAEVELCVVAEGYANKGDDAALRLIDRLAKIQPTEAKVILARWNLRKGKRAEAVGLLEEAFVQFRTDPWPLQVIMSRGFDLAREIAAEDTPSAKRLFAALEKPFAVMTLEQSRLYARADIAEAIPTERACVEAFEQMEPHVPWDQGLLERRFGCYSRWQHPLARSAAKELDQFKACQGWRGWAFCF